jgi:hypothetical protein
MDGLKWGREKIYLLKHGEERGFDSDASCSFGGTGDYDASCSFGSTFWETIFLAEVHLLFVFHFWFFLVESCIVHCPSFACFA